MGKRFTREPPIPSTTEFATIPLIRAVVTDLDSGSFRRAAILIERMLWNPRLRGALGTRTNGLIATKIRWQAVREEDKECRRAARELAEDWPFMAPAPQRAQNLKWGLMLGVAFAQRQPIDAPTSGRRLFRMRPYWPGWARWDWQEDVYKIQTRDGSTVDVASPADRTGIDLGSPWIVHEPFGERSWREGLLHALWRPWFGHEQAFRDLNRASEKHGIGALKVKYPAGKESDADGMKSGLRNLGSEGVVPCPQYPDQGEHAGFNVEPLEFTGGSGGELIGSALNTSAIAMAIVLLGHNLTTEVKGGSYAAAGVGEFIRSDYKSNDADSENATYHAQLAQYWAHENYGDPEIAPIAIYETDPPAVNQAMAQTYQYLSLAIRELKQHAPNVDVDALLERYRIPLLVLDKKQEQVIADIEPEDTAPTPVPAIEDESTPPPDGSADTAAAQATLGLTPTDVATIVKVDEGRKSLGLTPEGGAIGGTWIREHAAKLAATLPVEASDPAPQPAREEEE